MNNHSTTIDELDHRVLAIDLMHRGFGFVVLEGPNRLIDWGFKETRDEKYLRTQNLLAKLLKLKRPDTLVVEKLTPSPRSPDIINILTGVVEQARAEGLWVGFIGRPEKRAFFETQGAKTRQEIAEVLAECFPALESSLPPKRKAWDSEDPRLRIFGALAMALAYYQQQGNKTPPLAG